MTAHEIIEALSALVPDAAVAEVAAADSPVTPTLSVPGDRLVDVARALCETPGLEYVAFSDVTAVDRFPNRDPRFDVVYHLVSPHRRARVRLKVAVADGASMPTLTGVYPGAGWPEREVYDLFGIVFAGHADLRRLMMPEEWSGHPLRKDCPVQVRKDADTFMPLQVTAEEFRESLERDRAGRKAPARP